MRPPRLAHRRSDAPSASHAEIYLVALLVLAVLWLSTPYSANCRQRGVTELGRWLLQQTKPNSTKRWGSAWCRGSQRARQTSPAGLAESRVKKSCRSSRRFALRFASLPRSRHHGHASPVLVRAPFRAMEGRETGS